MRNIVIAVMNPIKTLLSQSVYSAEVSIVVFFYHLTFFITCSCLYASNRFYREVTLEHNNSTLPNYIPNCSVTEYSKLQCHRIFQTAVSQNIPNCSVTEYSKDMNSNIPLLGTYFNCILVMTFTSVLASVKIINFNHKSQKMPKLIEPVFLNGFRS